MVKNFPMEREFATVLENKFISILKSNSSKNIEQYLIVKVKLYISAESAVDGY